MFVLSTAFLRDAGAARFGFSTVPLAHFAAAAAGELDAVHLSTAVVAVEAAGNGVASAPGSTGRRGVDSMPSCWRCRRGSSASFSAIRAVTALPISSGFDPYPIVDVHLWHDGGRHRLRFCRRARIAAAVDLRKVARLSVLQLQRRRRVSARCRRRISRRSRGARFAAFLPALQRGKSQRAQRGHAQSRSDVAAASRHSARRRRRTADPATSRSPGAWTDTGWPDTMESAVRSGTQPRHRAMLVVTEDA